MRWRISQHPTQPIRHRRSSLEYRPYSRSSRLASQPPRALPRTRTGPRRSRALPVAWKRSVGAGEGIRTPDPLITNQPLYRTELRQPDQTGILARLVPSSQPTEADIGAMATGLPNWPVHRGHPGRCRQSGHRWAASGPETRSHAPRRWRTASKRTMPAATETFRLLTWPSIGIDATRSQRARTSRLRPCPSLPRTNAVGSVRSTS